MGDAEVRPHVLLGTAGGEHQAGNLDAVVGEHGDVDACIQRIGCPGIGEVDGLHLQCLQVGYQKPGEQLRPRDLGVQSQLGGRVRLERKVRAQHAHDLLRDPFPQLIGGGIGAEGELERIAVEVGRQRVGGVERLQPEVLEAELPFTRSEPQVGGFQIGRSVSRGVQYQRARPVPLHEEITVHEPKFPKFRPLQVQLEVALHRVTIGQVAPRAEVQHQGLGLHLHMGEQGVAEGLGQQAQAAHILPGHGCLQGVHLQPGAPPVVHQVLSFPGDAHGERPQQRIAGERGQVHLHQLQLGVVAVRTCILQAATGHGTLDRPQVGCEVQSKVHGTSGQAAVQRAVGPGGEQHITRQCVNERARLIRVGEAVHGHFHPAVGEVEQR